MNMMAAPLLALYPTNNHQKTTTESHRKTTIELHLPRHLKAQLPSPTPVLAPGADKASTTPSHRSPQV